MPAKQVVVRAVFRRCTAPESLSDTEQPAAVRCKPSLPTVSMLRAPSSDAVPHRTGNCQATPAAVVRCKKQEPTPVQSPLPAGVNLATATKALQPPSSQPSAPAALPRHRQKPPIATTTRHCHRPRWVSENDASKEVTTPKAPPSLVLGGQGFHLENRRNGDEAPRWRPQQGERCPRTPSPSPPAGMPARLSPGESYPQHALSPAFRSRSHGGPPGCSVAAVPKPRPPNCRTSPRAAMPPRPQTRRRTAAPTRIRPPP